MHKESTREIDNGGEYNTKIIVAKHRNGSIGSFDMSFIPHLTKFVDK